MSGTRLFNFRQGDRSEYLATYFFSAFGLSIPVPRQEDIGYDLVCSLADQEVGNLTFNNQFLVSVKSFGSPNIELKPSPKSSDLSHIDWLFRLELPLLLALVDKNNQEIYIYSTLPVWFLYHEDTPFGSISLIPRTTDTNKNDVSRPKQTQQNCSLAGKHHYDVDLGFPIARAKVEDLNDADKTRQIKEKIRTAVALGRDTAIFKSLNVPYFYWFHKGQLDGLGSSTAFITFTPKSDLQNIQSISPALTSLAMYYKSQSDTQKLNAVVNILKSVNAIIPDPIKAVLPELI